MVNCPIETSTITQGDLLLSMPLLFASSGLTRHQCASFCLFFLSPGSRQFSTSRRVSVQRIPPGQSRSWLWPGACRTIQARCLHGTTCSLPRSALRHCFAISMSVLADGFLLRGFAAGFLWLQRHGELRVLLA